MNFLDWCALREAEEKPCCWCGKDRKKCNCINKDRHPPCPKCGTEHAPGHVPETCLLHLMVKKHEYSSRSS
jgi:hypothetical protein